MFEVLYGDEVRTGGFVVVAVFDGFRDRFCGDFNVFGCEEFNLLVCFPVSFAGFVGDDCCELFVEIGSYVTWLESLFVVEDNCSIWLTVGFVG